ncbi:MAG: hypothetical protein ABL999_07765 [Pyrinomonadaceae bacterium]
MKFAILFFASIAAAFVLLPTAAAAQRDYFTAEEIELIRDAQKIDDRINVLTKIIDRRFDALKVDVHGARISPKEQEKWGVLPQSSRFELLLDIKRILQKAIDDIDTLAERPESGILPDPDDKKAKSTFAELFPKAVRSLGAAAQRYQPALKAELDKPNAGSEKGSILDSLDFCDQIVAAMGKLPEQVEKAKKGKN